MIERAAYDLLRFGLRILIRLWPLWLFWFVWSLCNDWWLDYLLTFPDRSTEGYSFAYRSWPTVALLGPVVLMLAAILAYRLHLDPGFPADFCTRNPGRRRAVAAGRGTRRRCWSG